MLTEAPGVAMSCVIVILDVDVQPLALVTVTVYVPGAVILADAIFPNPLSQEYVIPSPLKYVPVAVTLIDVLVQVNSVDPVLFVIPAIGAFIFCVMVILDVDVQPLAPVTVTVYVPGAVILADAEVPNPPLHE